MGDVRKAGSEAQGLRRGSSSLRCSRKEGLCLYVGNLPRVSQKRGAIGAEVMMVSGRGATGLEEGELFMAQGRGLEG